jgi:phage head maturation protease
VRSYGTATSGRVSNVGTFPSAASHSESTRDGQKWEQEKKKNGSRVAVRNLTDVDLLDVSCVTYPAYNQTSVSARSFDYSFVR